MKQGWLGLGVLWVGLFAVPAKAATVCFLEVAIVKELKANVALTCDGNKVEIQHEVDKMILPATGFPPRLELSVVASRIASLLAADKQYILHNCNVGAVAVCTFQKN